MSYSLFPPNWNIYSGLDPGKMKQFQVSVALVRELDTCLNLSHCNPEDTKVLILDWIMLFDSFFLVIFFLIWGRYSLLLLNLTKD